MELQEFGFHNMLQNQSVWNITGIITLPLKWNETSINETQMRKKKKKQENKNCINYLYYNKYDHDELVK